MSRKDPIFITGKCYYASITEPNTRYDPHAWKINIQVDDNNRSVIEAAKLPIRNRGDDQGDFVTIKRNVIRKNGEQNRPPVVMDSQNNLWDGKLVANGSTVSVKAVPFDWDYGGKSGVSADLQKVQIVDFIEYNDGGDFEPVEGGYVQEERVPF